MQEASRQAEKGGDRSTPAESKTYGVTMHTAVPAQKKVRYADRTETANGGKLWSTNYQVF